MFSMNTGLVGRGNASPPSRYELDRKCKSFVELAKKLEAINVKAQTVSKLFSPKALQIRNQLLEESKHLFRYGPIEHGKLVEDFIWKRVYYDYVRFFKLKKISKSELSLFRFHLISGIGHYKSLLLSFYKTFNVKSIENIVLYVPRDQSKNVEPEEDELTIEDINFFNDYDLESDLPFEIEDEEAFNETISSLVQRFCICIGDLSRYYVDFFVDKNERRQSHLFKMAEFYYRAAWTISPSNGMPFNQLGTLYNGDYLVAIYYFLRCLDSKKPFAGAINNFLQNVEAVNRSLNQEQSKTQKAIRKFIEFFARLFTLANEGKKERMPVTFEEISRDLDKTLIVLAMAMKEDDQDDRFTPQQMSHMICSIIILINRIRAKMEHQQIDLNLILTNDRQASNELGYKLNLAITFAYRFFFLMNAIIMEKEARTIERYVVTFPDFDFKSTQDRTQAFRRLISMSNDCKDVPEDMNTLDQLKSTAFQSIVGLLDIENEDDQQMNEKDSGMSDDLSDVIDKMIYVDLEDGNSSVPANRTNGGEAMSNASNDYGHLETILSEIYTQTYIPTVKFFCDYFQADRNFFKLLSELNVMTDLFESFIKLANALARLDFKMVTNGNKIVQKIQFPPSFSNLQDLLAMIGQLSMKPVNESLYSHPLSSELDYINLTSELSHSYATTFGISPHQLSAFHQCSQATIPTCKSGYLCVRNIVNFAVKLTLISLTTPNFALSTVNFDIESVHNLKTGKAVAINFQRKTDGVGYLQAILNKTEKSEDVANNNAVKKESKNDNVVDAAIENKGDEPQRKKLSSMKASNLHSPLVMCDPYVYLNHLAQIRELVSAKRILLIVPRTVIDFLNNSKAFSQEAADAWAFLSEEYLRASRNVRFIKQEDRLEIEGLTNVPTTWPRRLEQNREQDPNQARLKAFALQRELMEVANYLLVNQIIETPQDHNLFSKKNDNKGAPRSCINIVSNDIGGWNDHFLSVAMCNSISVSNMATLIEDLDYRQLTIDGLIRNKTANQNNKAGKSVMKHKKSKTNANRKSPVRIPIVNKQVKMT